MSEEWTSPNSIIYLLCSPCLWAQPNSAQFNTAVASILSWERPIPSLLCLVYSWTSMLNIFRILMALFLSLESPSPNYSVIYFIVLCRLYSLTLIYNWLVWSCLLCLLTVPQDSGFSDMFIIFIWEFVIIRNLSSPWNSHECLGVWRHRWQGPFGTLNCRLKFMLVTKLGLLQNENFAHQTWKGKLGGPISNTDLVKSFCRDPPCPSLSPFPVCH